MRTGGKQTGKMGWFHNKRIQYDITAGKNYLKDTDFMTLP